MAICILGQCAKLVKRWPGELQQDIGYLGVEKFKLLFFDIWIQERAITPSISRSS